MPAGSDANRYRLFFELSLDAMLLTTGEGTILDANPAACRLLRRDKEELVGSEIDGVFDPSYPVVKAWLEEHRGDSFESGAPLLRGDGSSFAAEVSAVRRPEGGLCVIFRDMTLHELVEETLEGSNGSFAALVESGPDLITLCNLDNTIRNVSPSAKRILGYEPEELSGIFVPSLIHPEDSECAAQEAARILSNPEAKPSPIRYRRKDGSYAYLETVFKNMADDPNVRGIVCNSRDVTERVSERMKAEGGASRLNEALERQVEQRTAQLKVAMEEAEDSEALLRLSEGRFRATFEQAAVGIAHVGLNGELLMVNQKLCDIVGYGVKELLSLPFQDITHPDDFDIDREWLRQLLEGENRSYSMEKIYLRKDGSQVWVNVTVSLVRDTSGEPEYLITVVEDIAKRKQAEEKLKRAEEKYRSIFENSMEGIFQATAEGGIKTANPALARMLGYGSPEELRENVADVGGQIYVDPAQGKELARLLRRRGSVSGFEGKARRKDGSHMWLSISARVVRDGDGEIAGFEGTAQDATQKKQAEVSLRRNLEILVALRAAGQVLGSTLESEEIGTRLLRIMLNVSSLNTAIITLEDASGELRIWRSVGLEELNLEVRYTPEAEEARRAAFKNGKPMTLWLRQPGADDKHVHGLYLPLQVRDRFIGVLEAYSSDVLMEEDAKIILNSLANQAASALENARLYGELAERERQLEEFVGKLIAAQEKERRKVAYEVHDGLAQVAAAAHQQLQAFARFHPPNSAEGSQMLCKALRHVQRTVGEARQVIAGLRPTVLDDFGIEAAIRTELEALKKAGWQVSYEVDFEEGERMPITVETGLFRIAQEAITNTRKHAATSRLFLSLERLDRKILLRILDWGRGFDPGILEVAGPGERVGMSSMRERANMLGGKLEIHSRPGDGTAIVVEVPLPSQGEGVE